MFHHYRIIATMEPNPNPNANLYPTPISYYIILKRNCIYKFKKIEFIVSGHNNFSIFSYYLFRIKYHTVSDFLSTLHCHRISKLK